MIIDNMRDDWEIDVPVVVNFFARPETFGKVFDVIKNVRPRQLFFIADGPREGRKDDEENCRKCREIADKISWNCEVYRFYNKNNKGLWDTYFDSMEEVFKIVDRCIFMEDDVIPSYSFFEYCRYLLERYKDDLRIGFITGINFKGKYDKPNSDYFFCGEGSLTAYALWKRTFISMNVSYRNDPYVVKQMCNVAKRLKPGYERRIFKFAEDPMWQGHIPHVEVYKNLLRFSMSQICIVPSNNLVCNIGLTSNATHSADNINLLPKATQVIFNAKTYDYSFPLVDPDFVVQDIEYANYVDYILGWNHPLLKICRRVEALFRHLIHGNLTRVLQKIRMLFSGKLND